MVTHVRALDTPEPETGRVVCVATAGRGRRPESTEALFGIGVGEDEATARDDALRRALALYTAASWDASSMQWASADELGDEALPVEELARVAPLETRDRIRWVEGFALEDGRPIWVPAVLVHLGLPVAVEPEHFWPTSSSGLAVAASLGDAVLGGLLDLVASDAFALAATRDARLPRLSPTTFDATTDLGVPAVVAQGSANGAFGMGAGTTTAAAEAAAIDDLARRRARLARDTYPHDTEPDATYTPADGAPVEATPSSSDDPIDLSKPALVARLRRIGLSGYAVDLTTDDVGRVGLNSVRVVVPGLCPLPPSPGWADHARLARVAQ